MLELVSIRKSYGAETVLDGVDAVFPRGSVSLLMGPNGVGKTTLVRCVLGLEPHGGEVRWNGAPLDPEARLVYPVFDDTPFHPGLTGAQNLRVLAEESVNGPLQYLEQRLLRRRVRHYSYGQRKRLALTAALNSSAELVLLDEPTNGLDVDAMQQLREDLDGLRERRTFLVTGHHLEFYEDLVDHVFVVDAGRLVEVTAELSRAGQGPADHPTTGHGGLTDVYAAHYPRARR